MRISSCSQRYPHRTDPCRSLTPQPLRLQSPRTRLCHGARRARRRRIARTWSQCCSAAARAGWTEQITSCFMPLWTPTPTSKRRDFVPRGMTRLDSSTPVLGRGVSLSWRLVRPSRGCVMSVGWVDWCGGGDNGDFERRFTPWCESTSCPRPTVLFSGETMIRRVGLAMATSSTLLLC